MPKQSKAITSKSQDIGTLKITLVKSKRNKSSEPKTKSKRERDSSNSPQESKEKKTKNKEKTKKGKNTSKDENKVKEEESENTETKTKTKKKEKTDALAVMRGVKRKASESEEDAEEASWTKDKKPKVEKKLITRETKRKTVREIREEMDDSIIEEKEEVVEEEIDEEYVEEKRGRKTKKKTEAKSKKRAKSEAVKTKTKKAAKPKKLPTKYKKGVFNPDVEIIKVDKHKESAEIKIYDECCVHCNNRNVFRASYTNNIPLLKACKKSYDKISSMEDMWSPGCPHTALTIAILNENKEAIRIILEDEKLKKNEIRKYRCHKPRPKLTNFDTGAVSDQTFGFKTRRLQATRGNKMGNAALLEDSSDNLHDAVLQQFKEIMETVSNPEILEYVTLIKEQTKNDNNQGIYYGGGEENDPYMPYLYLALKAGNIPVVKHYLKKGQNMTNWGFNQLHMDVLSYEDDDFDVKYKVSINKKSVGNLAFTPIHVAAINPNGKVLKRLIELGGDIHIVDLENRKAIHYAAACSSSEPLEYILSLGLNVDEPDKEKTTPLMIAAQFGRVHNVKLLLEHKANAKLKSKTGMSALHYAALKGHSKICKLIVEEGEIPVDMPGKDRMTPLMMACVNDHIDCVEKLFELNAKVNKKDKFKRSPLIFAVLNGHSILTSILLRKGADFNMADSSQNAPIHYACAYGRLDCVKLLLEAKCDINAVTMWRISALEIAMLKNHFGIVKFLLNNSFVDVNTTFDRKFTLLHHAVKDFKRENLPELEYLLKEKKADPNIQNVDGNTPLHIIAEYTFDQFKLFYKTDSNNNINYNYGNSYNYNVYNENQENEDKEKMKEFEDLIGKLFELFMQNNADLNLLNEQGKSPFTIALERRNFPLIHHMIKYDVNLIQLTKTNDSILHSLASLLFVETSIPVVKQIINKLHKLNNTSALNTLNDTGFTPLLYLGYTYNKQVHNFFNTIKEKEIFKRKLDIVKEAKKGPTNSSSKPSAKPQEMSIDEDESDESEIEDEDFEDEVESKMHHKSKMYAKSRRIPKRTLDLGINQTAFSYGINVSNQNIIYLSDINAVYLTDKDNNLVMDNSKNIFYNYLNTHVMYMIDSFIQLGCDVHDQVRQKLFWRNKKKDDPVPESELQNNVIDISTAFNSTNNTSYNNYNNNNGFGMARTRPAHRSSYPARARHNGHLNDQNLNRTTTRKTNIHDEYYPGVGRYSFLMFMIKFPIINLVKNLVEVHQVNLNAVDIDSRNMLHHLLLNYSSINEIHKHTFSQVFDIFVNRNIDLNAIDDKGDSAFLIACRMWIIDEMEKLYNCGANTNIMNKSGENALLYYIRLNDKNKVNTLLDKFDIDINYTDDKNRNCLHYLFNDDKSSSDIDMSLKTLLLSRKPNINQKDILGRTPLHYLFVKIKREHDQNEIDPIVAMSTLIDTQGCEIDTPDIFGNSPLHYACGRGASICSMTLIEKGADTDRKNLEGNTPLAYALMCGQNNFAIILLQQNACFNSLAFPMKERNEERLIKYLNLSKYDIAFNFTQIATQLNQKRASDANGDDEDDEQDEEESNKDSEDDEEEDDDDSYGGGYKSRAKKATNQSFNFANNTNNNTSKNNPDVNKRDRLVYDHAIFKSDEDLKNGVSLFRICVIKNYQGLIYMMVNKGYNIMRAIQDSFFESKYHLALMLLDKSPNKEVYHSVNDHKQNLFHIFALHGSNASNELMIHLLNKLYEKEINIQQIDNKGYTPLHYACEAHFVKMITYIMSKVEANKALSIINQEGHSPFICAVKGNLIYNCLNIIEILFEYKVDINLRYKESKWGKDYFTTPFLHLIRCFDSISPDREIHLTNEGRILIKLIEKGADINAKDNSGKDALMYCVINNNVKLFKFILKHCESEIAFDSVCNDGKSLLHYVISPFQEGSYENEELLTTVLNSGFVRDIRDKNNKLATDYAVDQLSGVNLRILKEHGIYPSQVRPLQRSKSIILENEWEVSKYDYIADSDALYNKMVDYIKNTEKVQIEPDVNGNFPRDTHVVVHDETNGYWDITMTKVKLQNGIYGEYLFYRMQLIHDKGRDVYIMWNRWGRIGEVGAYQRTPFTDLDEAKKEFKKIFKSKSANEWENKKDFVKQNGKYLLLNFKEEKLTHKDLLDKFDYKNTPQSIIPKKEIRYLFKDLTDTAIYYKAFNESGIDTEFLSFADLSKELIEEARSYLTLISDTQKELNDLYKTKKHDEKVLSKALELRNQIFELSNRYYELIPKLEFKNSPVRPIDSENSLKTEIMLLENLTYVEGAVKILLGALYRQKEINPIDYCMSVLNINVDVVDKSTTEFDILKRYIMNSGNNVILKNIFKIQRKGEADRILQYKDLPNHYLLFHGTKIFNYIGIFSSGLRIAPPEAPVTGYMYGKGVYLADMFGKSIGYCDAYGYLDSKNERHKLKYLMMCESVLGNMYELDGKSRTYDGTLDFLEDGYHSLKSPGSTRVDINDKFVMNNGVSIPIGKPYSSRDNNYSTGYPEYVVYNANQLRIRYLIQVESDSFY